MFWLACSVLSYGVLFAYFQRPCIANDYYFSNMWRCALLSLLGPILLVLLLLDRNDYKRYGLKFK